MYDFANRALSIEKHEGDIEELVGEKIDLDGTESPEKRQSIFLNAYRKNIKAFIGHSNNQHPRSSFVPIFRPGTDKLLYFLVYFTRHPKGIDVFKTESEKIDYLQRVTKQEIKLRNKEQNNQTMDLFGVDADIEKIEENNNKFMARTIIEDELENGPRLFCIDYWADLLEKTDLYPTDFQLGIKEMLKEKKIENLDADTSKRRSKYIKPDRKYKSERWQLI